MGKELVRYRGGKAAIQDTLQMKDDAPICCDRCDAEYRVHYSLGEINRPNGLENLRAAAQQVVNASHDNHLDSHPL